MSSTTHGTTPYYFVPGPSAFPVMAATGLLFVILGAAQWINGHQWGMPNVSSAQDWDNGPDGAPKPQRVS